MQNTKQNRHLLANFLTSKTSLEELEKAFQDNIKEVMENDEHFFTSCYKHAIRIGLPQTLTNPLI